MLSIESCGMSNLSVTYVALESIAPEIEPDSVINDRAASFDPVTVQADSVKYTFPAKYQWIGKFVLTSSGSDLSKCNTECGLATTPVDVLIP